MIVVDFFSGAVATALSNFFQITFALCSIGGVCVIIVRSRRPRIKRIARRFPGSGKQRARRQALRRLAGVRLFQRRPRLLASHIGQQLCALAIVEGGRMLFRAMSTADRVRALDAERPRSALALEMAFDGLLLLVASTALILVAVDTIVRLREWDDHVAVRRRIIRHYCRSFRGASQPSFNRLSMGQS